MFAESAGSFALVNQCWTRQSASQHQDELFQNTELLN